MSNGTGRRDPHRHWLGLHELDHPARMGYFNRDAHEDVVARDGAGALWLYRGTVSGFAMRRTLGSSGWNGMREITPVGGLDGDGYPDLLPPLL